MVHELGSLTPYRLFLTTSLIMGPHVCQFSICHNSNPQGPYKGIPNFLFLFILLQFLIWDNSSNKVHLNYQILSNLQSLKHSFIQKHKSMVSYFPNMKFNQVMFCFKKHVVSALICAYFHNATYYYLSFFLKCNWCYLPVFLLCIMCTYVFVHIIHGIIIPIIIPMVCNHYTHV